MKAAKHLLWFCSQANQKGSMKCSKYLWHRYQYHSGPRMSVGGASTQEEVKRCLRQLVGKCLLQRGTHPQLAWVECENKPAYLSGGTDLSLSLPLRASVIAEAPHLAAWTAVCRAGWRPSSSSGLYWSDSGAVLTFLPEGAPSADLLAADYERENMLHSEECGQI
ncbi:hypothetical protein MHYP_G00233970 [Metynnis hypsauchen]